MKFGGVLSRCMTFMTIKNPFPIVHDGQEYHGGIFGGVAPHGLSIASAANQLRVVYEHKQSSGQKQRYGEQHGDMAQVLSHVYLCKLACLRGLCMLCKLGTTKIVASPC